MAERGQERQRPGAGVRLSAVWVAAAILVPAAIALARPLLTVDLGYVVRAGQVMLDTRSLLRMDLFTFTAHCAPWVNQQWGAELVLAGAFERLGWLGLALLRAGLTAAVFVLTYTACRASGAGRRPAAWLTLFASVVLFGGLQLRAQLFGLVLFAALRWLVAGRVEHPRRLWWAIPLVAVWANVHGTFPLGIFVLLIAWVEDRVAHRPGTETLLVALLTVPATFLTPFGPRVWAYVTDLATNPLIREVSSEWRPPSLTTYTGALFFASVALAAVVLGRNRRVLAWPAWLEIAVFLVLASWSTRAVVWWAIVLTVTLARLPWAGGVRPDPRNRLNAALVAVVAILPLVASLRWFPYASQDPPDHLLGFAPVRLTSELRSMLQPGEPFANPQRWGSWFELALPGHPVFMDSRFEVVPPQTVRASLTISQAGPGWEEILRGLPIRVLVVDREAQAPLADALSAAQGWQEVYSDDEGLIFVRAGRAPPPPLPGCDVNAA